MLAVDTNVVVRIILNDDRAQAATARDLMAAHQVWLSVTVLLETEWVLRSAAGLARRRIHSALTALLGLPMVQVETPERIAQALDWFALGMDFADALHLTAALECEAFASFDRRLAVAARKAGVETVRTL
jgi:predicted nucleic-acid-binding protein